jgi:NAD(P) transhydrogenase subunit alpha
MIVGVPKETLPGEMRVALAPNVLKPLSKLGVTVHIEAGAGLSAGYADSAYESGGAVVETDRAAIFEKAEVIAQVNLFSNNAEAGKADLDAYREGQVVIGLADPLGATERIKEMAERGVTAFGMELIPRITRAQAMDALSSMAMLAGYRSALLAATHLPRCFPMFMTAAGTVKPARVFVIGAGVAGLQAIATCKRLGAVIHGYDIRPEVEDQVISVGGKFVKLDLDTSDAAGGGGYAKAQGEDFYKKQRELMAKVVADSDVVITTAAIPGRKSPVLVTADMVKTMAPGSVIVDLAAERGGNCELTQAGEEIVVHDVTILGPLNIAASIPYHASQMYGKNIEALLKHLISDEKIELDMNDEITAGTLMCKGGEVTHTRLRDILGLAPLADSDASDDSDSAADSDGDADADADSADSDDDGDDSDDAADASDSGDDNGDKDEE